MTATAAISTLRNQIHSRIASGVGQQLQRWAAAAGERLRVWVSSPGEGNGIDWLGGGCPQAFPGFNQTVVENTWRLSKRRMLCTDGRQRLAGDQTLDVCATPREMPRAIASFACWLDYLAADGIGVEIRKVDGWRTCAMVEGVPVPIRVRERMRRVSGASTFSARLERMLGGHIPSILVPSGKVELQLLRMGVAFASFPLAGTPTPALLETVSGSIRSMAEREVEYRNRMHAAAVAETAKRRTAKPARPTQPEAPSRSGVPSVTSPVSTATEMALLSAYSAGRLTQMLETLQAELGGTARGASQPGVAIAAGSPADATQMAESMVSLATAIQAASGAPMSAFAAPVGVAVITEGTPKASKSRRARRSRVA